VEKESGTGLVKVLIDVVEPVRIETGGATFEAVDLVAFGKEKLGQVRAVLAGATGD
jgi:hypothetical protein